MCRREQGPRTAFFYSSLASFDTILVKDLRVHMEKNNASNHTSSVFCRSHSMNEKGFKIWNSGEKAMSKNEILKKKKSAFFFLCVPSRHGLLYNRNKILTG